MFIKYRPECVNNDVDLKTSLVVKRSYNFSNLDKKPNKTNKLKNKSKL